MLNLHAFPFAVLPAVPDPVERNDSPDSFALLAPPDRFLPFVLSRPAQASRRLDCARVIDADTGAVVLTLNVAPATPTPVLGLAYQKYSANGTDYFVYFGAIVPSMSLPCGPRYRLVVDEFQSAAFTALPSLTDCLLAEWYHVGPLQDAPYGTGLRQRLYIPGGLLRFAEPRQDKAVTKDAVTFTERVDFLALTRAATFTTGPVPTFLAEALHGAQAHTSFLVNGQAYALDAVKAAEFSPDSGRYVVEVTVKEQQVLIRRGCPPPVLVAEAVPEGFTSAAWRCDPSSTQADYQDTGAIRCVQDGGATWTDTGNTRCQQA